MSDPFNCNNYYICDATGELVGGESFPCPDGDIFDETLLKCKPDGKCTVQCDQPGGDKNCVYSCITNPPVNSKKADPFDCSVFYECSDPDTAETCPVDKPYFNGDSCGVSESDCCFCRPYCYAGEKDGLKVEDPTDCRKYFVCLNEHEVPTILSECDDGEHFDYHARECSSTAPCITRCRNVLDQDGCIDPYTCQETGFFPICKTQCLRDFYLCLEVSDDYAVPVKCPDDLVFNPDTLTCVKNETCPYNNYYK